MENSHYRGVLEGTALESCQRCRKLLSSGSDDSERHKSTERKPLRTMPHRCRKRQRDRREAVMFGATPPQVRGDNSA